MENNQYSDEDVLELVKIFGYEKEAGKGETLLEAMKLTWSNSEDAQLYWAVFGIKLEDIPLHLTDTTIEGDARKLLEWRLAIGK